MDLTDILSAYTPNEDSPAMERTSANDVLRSYWREIDEQETGLDDFGAKAVRDLNPGNREWWRNAAPPQRK